MEKTVLFTASTFSHINSFHLPYLEEFRRLGWKVKVACGGNVPQTGTDYEIIPLPFEKSFFSAANFRAAAMLRKLYRKEKIDLVCCHTSLAAFFTRLAAMGIKNRPEICNVVHGYLFDDDTPTVKKLILKTAEAVTAGVTDTLAAMNDYDYRYAQEHRLGRKVVFTPGVGVNFSKFDADRSGEAAELRKSYGLCENSVALIFAAEFSARKSQRVLIDAMKELPENVFLFLPGDGELLEENRSYALRCGLSGRVIFPG